MSDSVVEQKLQRLKESGRPRVLDLFAGCGGFSLGFNAAGFNIVASVEHDPDATRSHGINFHEGAEKYSRARDICSPPKDLASDLALGSVAYAFDVIVDGPPCQAFARVGRPKLREIDAHPTAFIHDPRARPYLDGCITWMLASLSRCLWKTFPIFSIMGGKISRKRPVKF